MKTTSDKDDESLANIAVLIITFASALECTVTLSETMVRYQSDVDYVDSVTGERFLRHQSHQESHVSPPC